MRITDVNDDAKLNALNRTPRVRQAERAVAPTEATPRVQPINPHHRQQPRAQPERRNASRRAQQQPQLFDTRDPHERRQRLRRQDDRDEREANPNPPAQGIDVIV